MGAPRSATAPAPWLASADEERERTAQLSARARRGARAIFATRILSILATAASIAILPRLIGPADFGVWAMASLALAVANIVRELGLSSAIVQAPELTPQQRDAYFWTSIAVAQAAAALLALAAPFLADFYAAPLLRPVIWACCASIMVSGVGLVHAALLRRNLEYGRVAFVEGGGVVCGLAAGVAGAYAWRDVWALVAAHIASAAWMAISAVLVCRWRPAAPGRGAAKINLSFGAGVMLDNLLSYIGLNVGLLAGHRFGAADLGYFSRAQQLCVLTYFTLLSPITDTAFSLLSRLKSEHDYREAYTAMARKVCLLFFPCAAVLPIVSDDVVLAVLGPMWTPASPILGWLAPAIFGTVLAASSAQLMLSQGRGSELRGCSVVGLLLRAGGALIGSRFGVVGMAAGFSLSTLLLPVLYFWIAGRKGPVGLRDQMMAMLPGLPIAAAAGLAALAGAALAQALHLEAGWSRLGLAGGGAVLAWGLLCIASRPARQALLGTSAARG